MSMKKKYIEANTEEVVINEDGTEEKKGFFTRTKEWFGGLSTPKKVFVVGGTIVALPLIVFGAVTVAKALSDSDEESSDEEGVEELKEGENYGTFPWGSDESTESSDTEEETTE